MSNSLGRAASLGTIFALLLRVSTADAQADAPRKSGVPAWNVRVNPIDALFGRATGAVEYALVGPLSVGVSPTYVFSKPVYVTDSYDVKGWAMAGQLGFWVDGSPFRGMALKLHLEHETTTYTIVDAANNRVARTFDLNKVGGLLVSQSLHGGRFTFSTGIGIVKDVSWNAADHTVTCPGGDASSKCDVASGLGRGWDLVGEIALGFVF